VGEVAVRSTNLSCLSLGRRAWNPDGVEGQSVWQKRMMKKLLM
jgi:hypothetical protein